MGQFRFAAFASISLTLAVAAPVRAATVSYVLSGLDNASFQIDLTPTPSAFNATAFRLDDVAGLFPGLTGPVSVFFFTDDATPYPGGLAVQDLHGAGFRAPGPILFDPPTSAPTMEVGTFSLSALRTDTEGHVILIPNADLLTVTVSGVPEPASWALMVGGLGVAGTIMRRRAVRPLS